MPIKSDRVAQTGNAKGPQRLIGISRFSAPQTGLQSVKPGMPSIRLGRRMPSYIAQEPPLPCWHSVGECAVLAGETLQAIPDVCWAGLGWAGLHYCIVFEIEEDLLGV